MLPAYAYINSLFSLVGFFYCYFHQLAHSLLVYCLEWVFLENATVKITGDELACIIPGESQGRLCEVVRAKAYEVSLSCNDIGCQGGSWKLYHCSYLVLYLAVRSGFLGDVYDYLLDFPKFRNINNVRYLDHRLRPLAIFLGLQCCLENGLCLHLAYLGIDNSQPAASEAEHRVELMKLGNPLHYYFFGLFR